MNARGPLGSVKTLLAELCVKDGVFCETHVTLNQVIAKIEGFERRKVLRVMDRLCRDKDLEMVAEERVDEQKFGPKLRNPTWRVKKDPRLRRDNQVKSRFTCRDKVWSTLRDLRPRATTCSMLVRLTGCDGSAVQDSLKAFKRGGYVAAKGRVGREKLWSLVKDVGPKRPETPEALTRGEQL